MFQPTKISTGLQKAFGSAGVHDTSARHPVKARMMRRAIPVIAAALVGAPALAQTTTTTTTTSDTPDTAQRVTITGSMIPRTSAETSEAITVITADSLSKMGITSVEQALQQISANQSTVLNSSAVTSWGTGGGSYASLRGLGASRTLVLLDGQRLTGNAQYGGPVDLDSIPFAAIDHIEVLREGASSVYGADAISGVINFITKRDLTGGQLNVTGTKDQHPGGGGYGGDITYGWGDLSKDGFNLMGSLSYNKTNEIKATQRTFAQRGGADNSYFTSPGSYFDANGNLFSVDYPDCGKSSGVNSTYLTTANGYCGYKYTTATDLVPESSVTSGMLQFTKALNADNTLKLQYFATQSKLRTWGGAYSYYETMNPVTDAQYFPTAARSTPGTYYGTSATATPDLTDDISVAWTDPGNNRYQGDRSTQQRFLATLTGSHGDWDYQANVNYSQNISTLFLDGGYPDLSAIEVTDANGDQVLNPAINPFGPQTAAGQAVLDSSYRNGNLDTAELRMIDVSGSVSHPVGNWFRAGDATLAVGASARREQIHSATTPLASEEAQVTYYFPSDISGKRNEEAVYAELNVPVAKGLEFTASDREDRYSDFGKTNNAKLSFRYQPSKLLTFRGAASTGFRAPSMVDLYAPEVLGAGVGFTGTVCDNLSVNCAGGGSQGVVASGGNPNLKPEKSDNYDLGIVLSPTANLGMTLDFYRITISNQITTLSSSTIYQNYGTFQNLYHLNSSGTLSVAGDGSCPTLSAPTCGYVLTTPQNTGGVTTNGVDVSVSYLLPATALGRFRVGMEGTWTSQYKLQQYQSAPWLNIRGDMSQGYEPVLAWQDLLTLDWTRDVWGAGISNNYGSGYRDRYDDRHVGSQSLWNAYASWKPTKQITLLAGMRNLFDTKPSFSNQDLDWQEGFNSVKSDPQGRAIYGKVTVDF